jgi:hypothetical protein
VVDFVEKALFERKPRTRKEKAVAEAKRAAEVRALERKEAVRKAEEAYVEE